ncbi:MAG: hypothetical protein J5472_03960 [Clostridia bacterium]|nr:hypothetical protein [Clostridia bacterium]
MTDEIYNTPQDPGMQEAAENAVPQQPEIPQAYQEPAYGYPPQPAPAPQEGYQQPTYAAQPAPRARKARSGGNSDIPRFISKEKLPVIVGVLFAIFTGAALVNLIGNILGMASYDTNGVWNRHFGLELAFSILMLAGAVLMLLGALLKKPLIVTIGVFVAAPSVLRGFNLYGFIWPWITYGFEVVAVIVIGLYYVLRGHGINALFKKIAVFSGCGLAVGTILACAIVGFAKRSDLAAGTLIYLLIGLISALAMYAGLYLYRPGMRVFQEQPAIIQSGEPYPPVKMVKSLCIVLASLAAACLILGIVSSAVLKTSWLTWQILYAIFAVAGGVLMLIGAMLNRPNKLFSIGILTVALGVIFRMYVTGSIANFFSEKSFAFGEVIAAFLFFLELVCLACIGVHYFFHGNGVSTKWKTILTFVGLGTGVAAVILCDVMLIVHFCPRGADAARIVLSILFSVVDLAAVGTLFLPILFYKRGMMQRVQQPRAPRPQEPQQPW